MSTQEFRGQRIVERNKHKNTPTDVGQHNYLVEACYTMSVDEKRLVMLAMTKIEYSTYSLFGNLEVNFDIADWRKIFNSPTSAYTDIRRATKALMKRQVHVEKSRDGVEPEMIFNWVDHCKYYPQDGIVKVRFGSTCSEYLQALNEKEGNFTICDLKKLAPLSTFYSIRLYELLYRFSDKGVVYKTADQLRTRLDVTDKYPKFSQLLSRVIDPAIAEINKKTSLGVTYEVKYARRIAKNITFYFQKVPKSKKAQEERLYDYSEPGEDA